MRVSIGSVPSGAADGLVCRCFWRGVVLRERLRAMILLLLQRRVLRMEGWMEVVLLLLLLLLLMMMMMTMMIE